jgi:polysaccharide deacetylase family protein (PEP-CTERM system associated)
VEGRRELPPTSAAPDAGQPVRANAITVDVEEWFHICGPIARLAPVRWDSLVSRVALTTRLLLEDLEKSGTRATFFVLGWVAERYPSLVAEIAAAGHEIGSHSHLHTRVYELDPDSFRDDLRRSVASLSAAGASPVRAYRAPEWSINQRSLWALDVLASEGFAVDASMAPIRLVGDVTYPRWPHARTTASGSILEVPPLVADRFRQVMPLGWGWGLRMSSPSRVLRAVKEANRAGVPSVLTVHPWEVDPDPPRVSLPLRWRFAHYFRLGGFRARLSEILRNGEFGALADLDAVRSAVVARRAALEDRASGMPEPGSRNPNPEAASADPESVFRIPHPGSRTT